MSTDIVVESSVMPDHYYEWQHDQAEIWTAGLDGYPSSQFPSSIDSTDTINHDNALSTTITGTRTLGETVTTYIPYTNTYTPVVYPAASGAAVTITFPTFQDTWGGLISMSYLLTGDVLLTGGPATNIQGYSSVDPCWFAASHAPFELYADNRVGDGTTTWQTGTPGNKIVYGQYTSPYPDATYLVDGREHFMAYMNYKVNDTGFPGYKGNYQAGTNYKKLDGTGYQFHLWNQKEIPFVDTDDPHYVGPSDAGHPVPYPAGAMTSWCGQSGGSSRSVNIMGQLNNSAAIINKRLIQYTPGTTHTYSYSTKWRIGLSNFKLILRLRFNGNGANSSQFGHMGLTTFRERNVTAGAWFTKDNPPVTGKKQLMVGVHRGILGNMGTGSGSTAGWETYPYGDVDAGSDLGLEYFPNSNLYMSLDRYVGDPTIQSNAHPKYTINQVMGAGPINNQRTWADEQDIAGTKSEIIQGGYGDHAQKFPFKIRTGP